MRRYLIVVMTIMTLMSCQEPDFLDTHGNGYLYEDVQEKWMVLNYWATWCAPCITEIPELNTLAATYKDTLVVFGVNFDQPDANEMQEQVAKMKISFPVYSEDPAAVLGISTPLVLPTTFVFAPGGKLHATLVGPQTEKSLLEALEVPST